MLKAKTRVRKAWAIVDWRGHIQLDKVMASKGEAWGLLMDDESMDEQDLKKNGWYCVRIELRPLSVP